MFEIFNAKINTKISTEAELVGVSDYLPYPLWFLLFLKYQGYNLNKNVIFQDNQSAIRLEKNGRNSCTGNSRHIDIKYFLLRIRSSMMKCLYRIAQL